MFETYALHYNFNVLTAAGHLQAVPVWLLCVAGDDNAAVLRMQYTRQMLISSASTMYQLQPVTEPDGRATNVVKPATHS